MTAETQHTGNESWEVVRDIFAEHITIRADVLDLTWGQGTFWKWGWDKFGISLTTNDLYATPTDITHDFQIMPCGNQSFDVVVFDPPFTAQGPNKKVDQRHNDRYGSTRDLPGAPRNIHHVQALLMGGIAEACRIARHSVIVKTQDVVESGKLHANVVLAMNHVVQSDFNIERLWRFHPSRRAQPKGRRVTGLGDQASVFIVARRWK